MTDSMEPSKQDLIERVAELDKENGNLTTTCKEQSEHISERGEKLERLRKILWVVIWDNRGFTQEDIEWAGQYELDLANARIAELEEQLEEALANAEEGVYQADHERMRAETAEAELAKLRKPKDLCPVCLTWSWAPCDEGDEGAQLRGEKWVLCQCCNDSRIAMVWKGRAEELRKALDIYGYHKIDCEREEEEKGCTCGWASRKAALAKGDEK